MNKRKKIVICVSLVTTFMFLIFGSTYAFIVSMTNSKDVQTGSGLLNINYIGPDTSVFDDVVINPSSNKPGGIMTTANASLASDSVRALFNMYITPTAITNLNIRALKWEVEAITNGTVVYTNSGNFSSAEVDVKFSIVQGFELGTDVTTFNIYIWLDESLIESAIDNATFNIKIGADSTQITGDL